METRAPNSEEISRWNRFRNYFEQITAPKVKALVVLAQICESAESEIYTLTGTRQIILTVKHKDVVTEIMRRSAIIDRLIQNVLLKKYGVQFDSEGNLAIVGASANEGDIYPRDQINLGVAWFVVVGIAAVVLLIAGDQNNRRLAADTENEAIKLHRILVETDIKMMKESKEIRERWESWKDKSAKAAKAALRDSPSTPGWIASIFGDRGTSMLIAGAVGIAALYFLIPALRRN